MRRPRGVGRTIGSVVFISALVLVLAACGTAATTTPTSGTTGSTSSTATTTTAATAAATSTSATAASAASPTGSSSSYPGYGSSSSSTTPAASPAAPARGTAALQVATSASLGKILADSSGFTLYTFSHDTAGTSACTGTCAVNWPPLTVPSGGTAASLPSGVPGTLGTITRADGSTQVTYNGHPLYYFKGDTTAGTTNGNGLLNGAWKVVTPAAS